jgi:hypothetical protein
MGGEKRRRTRRRKEKGRDWGRERLREGGGEREGTERNRPRKATEKMWTTKGRTTPDHTCSCQALIFETYSSLTLNPQNITPVTPAAPKHQTLNPTNLQLLFFSHLLPLAHLHRPLASRDIEFPLMSLLSL